MSLAEHDNVIKTFPSDEPITLSASKPASASSART
jgi:hypothetical protein